MKGTMMDVEAWKNREYPGGVVDWKAEYERLLQVARQAVPTIPNSCARSILETAILVGDHLTNLEEKGAEMISKEVKGLAEKIGQFYLKKHNGDYEAAEKEIVSLQISKIEEDNGAIRITTARPGILIGRRGTNIEALIEYMGVNVKIIEAMDCLQDYLIPRPADDYDYPDMSGYDDDFPLDAM